MDGNLAYQGGWQDPRCEERLDGRVVMMAPTSTNHTFVSGNIFYIFKDYLKGKTCIPISDGAMVYLTENDHFVPDVMVICDRDKIKGDGVHGAPDLVVEVLSPSTAKNDRGHKKNMYAKCGVQEYWIADPANKSVEQYLLENGQFILHEVYVIHPDWVLAKMTEEERAAAVTQFKCSLYDDLTISLDDIFHGLLS